MDILYTVEEKYLQAIEELNFGELPKALRYFNEIIESEPNYARAYYQLGCFYHYQFKNYQTAGYYYKKCIELEAEFPDVYEHYLKLLILLKLDKAIETTAEKALGVPGVCKANIYENLGIYQEEQLQFDKAREHYRSAALASSSQNDHTLIQDHLRRIEEKKNATKSMTYAYQGN